MHTQLFSYPTAPHQRRHGPAGYEVYHSYKPWLRDEFCFRCVFCLTRETWQHDGHKGFSVEHLKPKHKFSELTTEYDNLVYACCACNSAKAGAELMVNPCQDCFSLFLEIQSGGEFRAKSDEGRYLIEVFDLNEPEVILFRKTLIDCLVELRKKSDAESADAAGSWLRWPSDLPDLGSLRPPHNKKREGILQCYFALRQCNKLPPWMP